MAPPSIEDYIAGFPNPIITKIQGLPTYETIAEVQRNLNANAASIETTLGGGTLGYLALTVDPAVYLTLAGVAFVAPVNPGWQPVIAPGATGTRIAELVRQHTEEKRIWSEYVNIGKALKQQLLSAVDELYVRSLKNATTGFANVSVWQMLSHLLTTYGRVTPNDLLLNDQRMRTPYSIDQPLEVLIGQIEDAVTYAVAGNQGYTNTQIVNLAYSIIMATGHFEVACREWRLKIAADRTWANWKTHFAAAYNDLRETAITTKTAGFHGAHLATPDFIYDTAEALNNLATATVADREAVANLVVSNATLTQQLAAKDAIILDLRNQLKVAQNNQGSQSTRGTGAPRTGTSAARRPLFVTSNNNYCWSHGYQVGKDHTSETCTKPREGHQRSATLANTLGGSTYGKPL
jgi:hypothetical protein